MTYMSGAREGVGLPGDGNVVDWELLRRALRGRVDGEVRFDAGTLAAYSTDASNYRQVPIGVVIPRHVEAGVEAIAVCREYDVPVVSRGGGTSLAGQATNAAVMIDWAKYCHRLIGVDADARTCVVEPGIVLDVLNEQLREFGLGYGPKPATHPNCTLGGMIGNNSCGATAQRTGKVVDNIARLEVLLYDGTRFWCGQTTDEEYVDIERHGDRRAHIYRQLRALRDDYADQIRERYPHIPRRVSGYNLDSLLPEFDFDVAGLLVGSESTLVTVLRAELKLLPVVKHRSLVVLGYDTIADAADAVPDIVSHDPIALEGFGDRLVKDEQLQHLNASGLAQLPDGSGYLMVQFGGDTAQEADQAAHTLVDALGRSADDANVVFLDNPEHAEQLWEAREAGLGAAAHVPDHPPTWPGWEDAAVDPARLGDYLRELEKLFEDFGYADDTAPSLYGHFGQGCVHTRIPFDLRSAEGIADMRRFAGQAAELVVKYNGSLSGEHGDGQARGELLTTMFGDNIVGAFGQLKAIFDPTNRMNPGKVVDPNPLDRQLRLGADWAPTYNGQLHFSYVNDGGSFVNAATRCVGVGKCRQHTHEGGSVMCPSYQVTGEEQDATRGRARLLFEMLNGHPDSPISDGWRSTEVRDALDLCLSCKGCKSDCPVDVDMATYKAEFLAHHYEGRLRPRSHYALGWLPLLSAGITRMRVSKVVNALAHAPVLPALATRAAGLEAREIPLFAHETLQQWWVRRGGSRPGPLGRVLLWPDTFTNDFHPHIGHAAVAVLEGAGWEVVIPTEPLCCALTWISTGQLNTAKRVLRRTAAQLADHVRDGGLVVGLEPSCTAVFHSDAPDLLPEDLDIARLRDQMVTFAELLTQHTPSWTPPRLDDVHTITQVHCHHHAVLDDWAADEKLLSDAGATGQRLDSGCCGLAGNFGFEAGHLEVSMACAESVLLPALRNADPASVVLADGFSCRTQIHELDSGGREGLHLAELLHRAQLQQLMNTGQDLNEGDRPRPPGRAAQTVALVGVCVVTAVVITQAGQLARRVVKAALS